MRKRKLTAGKSPLNPAIKSLFPKVDYIMVLVVSNEQLIAFLYQIDTKHFIYRVFSLVAGEHVTDEILVLENPFYAICCDCFNMCYWVIVRNKENHMCVKKYFFNGSIDFNLFGFMTNSNNTRKNSKFNNFRKFFFSIFITK